MDIRWHVGDVIAKVREGKKMTRAALANKSGLSAYSVGQIEATGNCRNATLSRIAVALNVGIAYLYDEIPKPAPQADAALFKCNNVNHTTLHEAFEDFLKTASAGTPAEGDDAGDFHPVVPDSALKKEKKRIG